MFVQAVPSTLKSNLESLGESGVTKKFYLAGGTALALQLGHRVSYDLDFFTSEEFSQEDLISKLKELGNLTVDHRAEDTFLGNLNGTKISFFWYRYPLIFPTVPFLGIALADIREIGAMKIDAVQSRGKKRDFIDLWAILSHGMGFEELINFFQKKYSGVNYNMQHIVSSLAYFSDAENDPMPQMLIKASWEDVKKYIETEAIKFTRMKSAVNP